MNRIIAWSHILVTLSFFSINALTIGQQNTAFPTGAGQPDSMVMAMEQVAAFSDSLLQKLPVVTVDHIRKLNPSLYRNDKFGDSYIDGFLTSGKYCWYDGVPVDYSEEMPLRAVNSARFNGFEDYFRYGNSLTGFFTLEPEKYPEKFSCWVDESFSLVKKQFNDNYLAIGIAGPIKLAMNKQGRSTLNYALSGRLFSSRDPFPSYVSRNMASDDWHDNLVSDPLRPAGYDMGTYANANYTHPVNAISTYLNPNAGKNGYALLGSIRLDLENGLGIKLGNYTMSKKEHIPDFGSFFFNNDRNRVKSTFYTNVYMDLEQELELGNSVGFRYEIRGQYTSSKIETGDPVHKKDFFSYGYAGKFDTYKTPTFELGWDSVNGQFYDLAWILNSWDYDTLCTFSPGQQNPLTAGYTSAYYEIYQDDPDGHYRNQDQVHLGGGVLNGLLPNPVYDLWNNVGTVYNNYSVSNQDQVNIFADGQFDIGKHKVGIGFQFSRASYAAYSINPVGLWGSLGFLTNYHIRHLDIDNPYVHEGDDLDTIFYSRLYEAQQQQVCDMRLRKALGLGTEGVDFIEIDSHNYQANTISYYDAEGHRQTVQLTGNPYSIDLFSADELYQDNSLGLFCSGYDYTGKKISRKVSFDDFFNAMGEDGVPNRYSGAFVPLNYAAYVNYELTYKGWSFNAGLRMDAYNANQQVLKDPYLFYEAYTVGDLEKVATFSYSVPSGIGSDYVVYVDNVQNPGMITGYRDGDQWYNSSGEAIYNPWLLDAGSGVNPYVVDPQLSHIVPDAFKSNQTWFNLLPQLEIRKAFAKRFLFNLKYNSSTSNPLPSTVTSNPALYYYFNGDYYLPNGSLKPQRADQVEAGLACRPFSGTIISLSGFAGIYSNLVVPYLMQGAYPRYYYFTYWNMDKPVTKYGADLGWHHNSGKTSGFNYGITYHLLIDKNKDLEFLFDFNQPKNLLKGYLAYNTGWGQDYAGPAGKKNYRLFESLGIGAFAQFQSGVEYTRMVNLNTFKDKLPSAFFMDIRIDKGFHFGNGKYFLDVFCVIQNLLNSKVVYQVYRSTGEPDDDGYLTTPENQMQIAQKVDEEAYRFLYSSHLQNPDFYGLPRSTTLGLSFRF